MPASEITLAGYEMPDDRVIDGVDQTDLLLGRSETGARDHYRYSSRSDSLGPHHRLDVRPFFATYCSRSLRRINLFEDVRGSSFLMTRS